MHTLTTLLDDVIGHTVVIDERARRQIEALVSTAPVRSILGFLSGPRPQATDTDGYRVIVKHAFEGKDLLHHLNRPLWTAETMRDAEERAKQPAICQACCLIGWLFSQPGWGVHVTEEDLSFHRGYFQAGWAIFIGIDPILRKVQVFGWSADDTRIGRLDYEWQWQ